MSQRKPKAADIQAHVTGTTAHIKVRGRIYAWQAEYFEDEVDNLLSQGAVDLHFDIISAGGSSFAAAEMANSIAKFPGKKTAHLGALVASAATYLSSKCDYVTAPRNINMMVHKPHMDVWGNEDQIESELKLLKNVTNDYLATYVAFTGIAEEEFKKLWLNDYWMNAEEAKSKKFIHEIRDEDGELDAASVADVRSLYKDKVPDRLNALLGTPPPTPTNPQQKPTSNSMDKKSICAVLGLDENIADDALKATIEDNKRKAAAHAQAEAQARIDAKAKRGQEINVILDQAINVDKKFTADYRESFRLKLEANFDTAKAEIEAMKPTVKLSDIPEPTEDPKADAERAKWDYETWMEKDPQGLSELGDNDPAKFEALSTAYIEKYK